MYRLPLPIASLFRPAVRHASAPIVHLADFEFLPRLRARARTGPETRHYRQERLVAKGGQAVATALLKHDSKARPIKTVDDFTFSKEVHQLQVAQDLGLLDKAEKTTLGEALDLRNRCGHPNKYSPGVKKVSSFIEDVISIVFKA